MRYSEWNSVPEFLVENLRKRIENGDYKIGCKLPTEKEICQMFNVGRSSAREALHILQAMGFVQILKGKGTFVTNSFSNINDTIKEWYASNKNVLEDLIDVRISIECLAVRRAVLLMTDSDILELERINRDFKEKANADNIPALLRLDADFHRKIAKASQNELIVLINKQIESTFEEYRGKAYIMTKHALSAAMGHDKILEYIKNKDVQGAEEAMKKHIAETLCHISEALKIENNNVKDLDFKDTLHE